MTHLSTTLPATHEQSSQTPALPDGHYIWETPDRHSPRGYTFYIASIRGGKLVALTVNGVPDNGMRALAEAYEDVYAAIIANCVKPIPRAEA